MADASEDARGPAPESAETRNKRKRINVSAWPRDKDKQNSITTEFLARILGSYAPAAPFVPPRAKVASLGSCFAEEIAKSLAREGIDVTPIFLSERWNTAFALRHFLANAMADVPFPEGYLPEDLLQGLVTPGLREKLASCEVFILTFGLSVCWFEKASGRMVLEPRGGHEIKSLVRAMDAYDMRQTTVEQNESEIVGAVEIIRRVCPNAAIVLTLSPIPLLLSLADEPVVPSNIISKSVLRVALHNVAQRKFAGVYYWPSYDYVNWLGTHVTKIYGTGENDLRHIAPEVIHQITTFFRKLYFTS